MMTSAGSWGFMDGMKGELKILDLGCGRGQDIHKPLGLPLIALVAASLSFLGWYSWSPSLVISMGSELASHCTNDLKWRLRLSHNWERATTVDFFFWVVFHEPHSIYHWDEHPRVHETIFVQTNHWICPCNANFCALYNASLILKPLKTWVSYSKQTSIC